MTETTAQRVMEPVGPVLAPQTPLRAAAALVSGASHGHVALVDADGHYRGVVSARMLAEALSDGDHDPAPTASIAEHPPAVHQSDTLDDTLDVLDAANGPVPVLDPSGTSILGWLTHQRILIAQRAG